ncbi:hypothetical protein M758_6G151700 [Ceratodon purpureus]|uniref:Uncharacterized protein n=1 Tax=Ceratodon purpureus TaxID=3225 RepID=A0A8T0HIC1_CERPU|nr:hypothetical protein KC19_6G156900 [Ceratodon purpureus]KAG0614106.1 hypothetical protein M758_6G151700 [Ceratodon purpureus]
MLRLLRLQAIISDFQVSCQHFQLRTSTCDTKSFVLHSIRLSCGFLEMRLSQCQSTLPAPLPSAAISRLLGKVETNVELQLYWYQIPDSGRGRQYRMRSITSFISKSCGST